MLRKLSVATALSLGVLTPLAVTPAATAHEYRHEQRHHHLFRVYFRDSCNHGWTFGASFCGRREAERYAAGYRCRGLEVVIR
jgi:hypothetical protein